MYNGNFDITRMLDQSNLSTQRCRLIFWVECSVGGYLILAKTILIENVIFVLHKIVIGVPDKIKF
jgi:hypothetical protein